MALTESSMVARGSPRGIAAERLLKVELAPSTTRPWKEMLRKSSPANWISSGLAFGRHKTGFDFFSRDRFSTINVCSSRPSLFFLKKKRALATEGTPSHARRAWRARAPRAAQRTQGRQQAGAWACEPAGADAHAGNAQGDKRTYPNAQAHHIDKQLEHELKQRSWRST